MTLIPGRSLALRAPERRHHSRQPAMPAAIANTDASFYDQRTNRSTIGGLVSVSDATNASSQRSRSLIGLNYRNVVRDTETNTETMLAYLWNDTSNH
jgi:hypothetical protein